MTKSELIRCIAERFPTLTVADVDAAVDLILEQMTQTLAVGHRIKIRRFGSFALNYRPPRQGRNPKPAKRSKSRPNLPRISKRAKICVIESMPPLRQMTISSANTPSTNCWPSATRMPRSREYPAGTTWRR